MLELEVVVQRGLTTHMQCPLHHLCVESKFFKRGVDDAHAMFDDSGHDFVELFAYGCFASTPRIKNFELEDPR